MAKNKKQFQVGDSVRVKNRIKDHRFGIDVGGWQGQISEIDNDIIHIEWDSVTFSTFPDEYISHCQEQGLNWEKIYLNTEEVEHVIRHKTENALTNKIQEFHAENRSDFLVDSGESESEIESESKVHEFDYDKSTSSISQLPQTTNQTRKTIGKWSASLGFIGLVVGILASYNYLSGPEEEVVRAGITPQDSQATVDIAFEADLLVSSTTSAVSKKLNIHEGAIEQASPSPSEAILQLAKLTQAMQTPPALPQPSTADANATSKGEVVQLLKLAALHFKADRLMAPKYNNALYVYQKILRLDEDNPVAQAGINRIKTKLMRYASDAQAQNDLETARIQLKKILVIDPQDGAARAALEKLQ